MNPAKEVHESPPPILPAIIYSELRSYLRESGSTLSPSEALIKAVQFWIAKDRADAIPARGYQWKQLFLPEGTRIRMHWNAAFRNIAARGISWRTWINCS